MRAAADCSYQLWPCLTHGKQAAGHTLCACMIHTFTPPRPEHDTVKVCCCSVTVFPPFPHFLAQPQVNAEAQKISKDAEEANAIAVQVQSELDKAIPALTVCLGI